MKSKFSKSWSASVQPRKQRKFVTNAPNHIKRRLMGATLDRGLRTKYGIRSIEVRKGDGVKVMRGKFRGKQGKVGIVDVKNMRIQIDGLQRAKKGGEKVETWFHPSNVKIIVLDEEDKKRLKRKSSDMRPEKLDSSNRKSLSVKPTEKLSSAGDLVVDLENKKIENKSKEVDKK